MTADQLQAGPTGVRDQVPEPAFHVLGQRIHQRPVAAAEHTQRERAALGDGR